MRQWNHGLRLTLPAILAASAASCAADDAETETGGDTQPGTTDASTTGASTTGDESSSSSPSTSGADTGTATDGATGTVSTTADGTSETGELPDCGKEPDEATCALVDGCEWRAKLAECIVDCTTILDEATCMEQPYCFWLDDGCVFGVV
jgi:hypothetical protein